MVAILHFRSEQLKLCLIYKSHYTTYQVSCQLAFGSGEVNNKFSKWRLWRPSWIFVGIILAIFVQQVIPILPAKFRVNLLFGSGQEVKYMFKMAAGGHLGFPIGTTLTICGLQNTPIRTTKHGGICSFKSGGVQNRFLSRGGHLGFLIGTILAIQSFYLQVTPTPIFPTKFGVDGLSVQKDKLKIDFKLAGVAAMLDFRWERFYLFLIYKAQLFKTNDVVS